MSFSCISQSTNKKIPYSNILKYECEIDNFVFARWLLNELNFFKLTIKADSPKLYAFLQ
jgi:hypothetical protein